MRWLKSLAAGLSTSRQLEYIRNRVSLASNPRDRAVVRKIRAVPPVPLAASLALTDLIRACGGEKLGRLKIFSWLSPAEITVPERYLKMQTLLRNEVVFGDPRPILLKLMCWLPGSRELPVSMDGRADACR
jgi:hypothetical protein